MLYKSQFPIALLGILALSVLSCSRNEDAHSILNNGEKRNEIYAEIMNNHDYMKQLLDSMRGHEHARMMLQADTAVMGSLFKGADASMMMKHVMAKAEKDSLACKQVCNAMMGHKKTMEKMLETMEKKGVVSKECMKSNKTEAKPEKEKAKHH